MSGDHREAHTKWCTWPWEDNTGQVIWEYRHFCLITDLMTDSSIPVGLQGREIHFIWEQGACSLVTDIIAQFWWGTLVQVLKFSQEVPGGCPTPYRYILLWSTSCQRRLLWTVSDVFVTSSHECMHASPSCDVVIVWIQSAHTLAYMTAKPTPPSFREAHAHYMPQKPKLCSYE